MKATWSAAAAMALILGFSPSSSAGNLKLEIRQGRVTLEARDVTVREILAEWARVGHTKVVNAEKMPGGPVTIQLTNVPERQALEVLLRSVTGYLAAPRAQEVADGSIYERILVMPTMRAAASTAAPSASPVVPAPAQRGRGRANWPPGRPGDDEDELLQDMPLLPGQQPAMPPGAFPGQPGMAPGMSPGMTAPALPGAFQPQQQQQLLQQMQQMQGGAAGVAVGTPVAPPATVTPWTPTGGVAVPGQVVQPPRPQQQQQPMTPPRPPGGDL